VLLAGRRSLPLRFWFFWKKTIHDLLPKKNPGGRWLRWTRQKCRRTLSGVPHYFRAYAQEEEAENSRGSTSRNLELRFRVTIKTDPQLGSMFIAVR